MKLNRKWIMIIALVMSMAMATGGTLAYLTDRDSEANVFTFGDVKIEIAEKFEPESPLVPNVKVEKEVAIKNTGNTDAWVWYTITYPKALDLTDTGETILWTGFTTENHDNTGYEGANDGVAEWLIEYAGEPYLRYFTKDGVDMVEFTVLYQQALAKNETTPPSLECVYLDKHIDIDPDGNLTRVENGNVEKIDWNVETHGYPTVYISAYAIQKEGFNTVQEAYAAYTEQWGSNGTEYDDGTDNGGDEEPTLPTTSWLDNADTTWYNASETSFTLDTAAELAGLSKLVANGTNFANKTITLTADIDLGSHLWTPIGQTGGFYSTTYFRGTFDGGNKTISNLYITETNTSGDYAVGLFGFVDAGKATIQNVKIDGAVVNGHHWTAALVGYMTGKVDNCHVTNATITCTHANDDACGDKAGVLIGYLNDNGSTVTNNSAKNCTVKAGRDAGVIIGTAYPNMNNIKGNSFENVTVEATGDCTGANIDVREIGREM